MHSLGYGQCEHTIRDFKILSTKPSVQLQYTYLEIMLSIQMSALLSITQ